MLALINERHCLEKMNTESCAKNSVHIDESEIKALEIETGMYGRTGMGLLVEKSDLLG